MPLPSPLGGVRGHCEALCSGIVVCQNIPLFHCCSNSAPDKLALQVVPTSPGGPLPSQTWAVCVPVTLHAVVLM